MADTRNSVRLFVSFQPDAGRRGYESPLVATKNSTRPCPLGQVLGGGGIQSPRRHKRRTMSSDASPTYFARRRRARPPDTHTPLNPTSVDPAPRPMSAAMTRRYTSKVKGELRACLRVSAGPSEHRRTMRGGEAPCFASDRVEKHRFVSSAGP